MSTGFLGSIGKLPYVAKNMYTDYEITLVLSTEGVNNWQPYSTAGTDCYVYDYKPLVDFPNSGFSGNEYCEILPRGVITETLINKYSWLNAVETTLIQQQDETLLPVVRFYSFRGTPDADIPLTLRIWKSSI